MERLNGDMERLNGTTILVTGSSTGIGRPDVRFETGVPATSRPSASARLSSARRHTMDDLDLDELLRRAADGDNPCARPRRRSGR